MAVVRDYAPALFVLVAGCNLITGAADLTTGEAPTSTDRHDARAEAASPADDGAVDGGIVDPHSQADATDIDVTPEIHRRVFVTSTSAPGNLGGLSGADSRCSMLAASAKLGGDWVAWLSVKDTAALERLSSNGPWYLVDDTLSVRSKGELQDDVLGHAINLNESGGSVPNDVVWTGTRNGAFNLSDCSGWTSSSSAQGGMSGNTNATTTTWTANIPDGCSASNRLYCFEQ